MKLSKRELFLLEKFEEVRAVAEELERLAISVRRDMTKCHYSCAEKMIDISEKLKYLARGRNGENNS